MRCLAALCILISVASASASETIATYELKFTRLWTPTTHPLEFPSNRHFSGLIGSSHEPGESFWTPGDLASQGVEDVAERGDKTRLRSEIDSSIEGGVAGSRIDFFGISSSRVVRTEVFRVRQSYDQVSIISMVAPSPDWFIGVREVDLYGPSGWAGDLQFDLYSYDAGTDSGETFTSRNANTSPAEPIAVLTGSPLDGTLPIASFGFRLLGVEDAPLIGDYNNDGVVSAADYTVWRDHLDQEVALPNEDPLASPDAVTGADYHAWRRAYASQAATALTVPEPSGWLLLAVAVIGGRSSCRTRTARAHADLERVCAGRFSESP